MAFLVRVCSKKLKCSSNPSPSMFSFSRFHNLASAPATSSSFTWDHVFRDFDQNQNPSLSSNNLQDYLHRVNICNRGAENLRDFIPFKVENHVAGYVHHSFADKLREFKEVFSFPNNSEISLHSLLKTSEDRTTAIGAVVKSLREVISLEILDEPDSDPELDEEYPFIAPVMSSFGSETLFLIERAAAPYFGIKTYGVHLNGYVELDGIKNLWIGKRSESKPIYPGMLEHLVGGSVPQNLSCRMELEGHCEDVVGIMSSIASQAIPVGVVSYRDIEEYRYKREIIFCYDLKLCAEVVPKNQNGDVSIRHVPAPLVAKIIQRTEFFKPKSNLIIIDFLVRHGYIKPEDVGYLKLLRSLRDVTFLE